ncbi:hypothetical protein [Geopseudomonas aromaticivorans]
MSERKVVTIEMPTVSLDCPYCGHEDDHAGRIFTPEEDGRTFATGETYCEKCEQWFDVVVE